MLKKIIIIAVALFLVYGFMNNADTTDLVNSEPITEVSLLDVATDDIVHYVEYFDAATNKLVSLKTTADEEYYLTITDDLNYDAAKITKQQYYIIYIMMADNNVTPIKIVDGKLEIR